MSGHSKFANIKHKKERNDAARGKIFTSLGREIAVAVKSGGADPASNTRLKDVISKAKSNNMPNDTIERSIKKAAGNLSAINYESILYEGYGPRGVAVLVSVLTDNRNRSSANVRNAFNKGGGNMGASGCVAFLFSDAGIIGVKTQDADEDELTLTAIEAGADDIEAQEDYFEIQTAPGAFYAVIDALRAKNIPVDFSELTKLPQTKTVLTDPEDIKKMNKLLELLEDDDDVTDVYHNWEN